MTYIEELKEVIRKLHGVEVVHRESVPVKEMFQGQIVWDGVVQVFDLIEHPFATKVYAWTHKTDDPKNPLRHVTVLNIDPITSPQIAVRAAIVQEFRSLEPTK